MMSLTLIFLEVGMKKGNISPIFWHSNLKWQKPFLTNLFPFNLRTEAYTSTLGLLTEWLTYSSVRKMILTTLQRWKKHIQANLLQGFRQ